MSEHYDVVIVGGGVAGAIVAKVLSHAKKSVLILEAGLAEGLEPSSYRSYVDNYYQALAKVPNSPYPINLNAPSQSVLDISKLHRAKTNDAAYIVQKGPLPFGSDYLRAAGGTTLHWLGTTLRMLPNDFRLHTLYGHGADWPLSYDDLRPYYEMAEREIGVSADAEEQRFPGTGDEFFSADYQYPMHKVPQSFLDRQLIEKVSGTAVRVGGTERRLTVVHTPQGRNSTPNAEYALQAPAWDAPSRRLVIRKADRYTAAGALDDLNNGHRCEGNSSCVQICPAQAKYNALKTLRGADHRYAQITAQAVADRIEIDPLSGRVTGVSYKRYHSRESAEHTTHIARGTLYVIASNAIESAKLLLASDAARTSNQLGRNLMDHPVMLTWGLMSQKVWSYRGPGSTSNIPSFRDGRFRKKHAGFIIPVDNWGWGWPTFAPGSTIAEALERGLYGQRLRRYIEDVVPRQFSLHFEFEQLGESSNRVTIDNAVRDRLGNHRPVVQYNVNDYTRAAMAVAKRVSDQIFERLGAEDHTDYGKSEPGYLTYKKEGYAFRGAGHLIGTHRMGFSPDDSVVNRDLRAWDHDNLYVVGAGSMPTTGTCNPTLTVAALSFRAAEGMLRKLSDG